MALAAPALAPGGVGPPAEAVAKTPLVAADAAPALPAAGIFAAVADEAPAAAVALLAMVSSPARCALVGVALLFALFPAPLLVAASDHDAADHIRTLRGTSPRGDVLVALGARAREDLELLAHGLAEPCEEGLKIAHSRAAHPPASVPREFLSVGVLIALKLGELHLALAHAPLARGHGLRAAALLAVHHPLHGLESFALSHLGLESLCAASHQGGAGAFSASSALSAVRLAAKLTRSRMSCCRYLVSCGQAAIAASMRGSLPRWYAPIEIKSRLCS